MKYNEPTDRMALAMGAYCRAKDKLVTAHGIGEKAPLTFFAWKKNKIVFVGQALPGLDKLERERFETVVATCAILRRTLGAEAFSVGTEGFRCKTRSETPLEVRFASGDTDVTEIAMICHVEPGINLVCSRGFTYGVQPRRVIWENTLAYEDFESDHGYAGTLQRVLASPAGSKPLSVTHVEAQGLRIWLDA